MSFPIQNKPSSDKRAKEAKRAEMKQRLDKLMQLDIAEVITHADTKISQYYLSFTQQQRKAILQNTEKLKAFLRADLYADFGFANKDAEAYVAQSVFNYKKKEQGPGEG